MKSGATHWSLKSQTRYLLVARDIRMCCTTRGVVGSYAKVLHYYKELLLYYIMMRIAC